jgi:putative FmdB family regulatory protein
MPRYEYLCEKCKKPFELIMTIAERERPSRSVLRAKA